LTWVEPEWVPAGVNSSVIDFCEIASCKKAYKLSIPFKDSCSQCILSDKRGFGFDPDRSADSVRSGAAPTPVRHAAL
jgi:hypothetical protein